MTTPLHAALPEPLVIRPAVDSDAVALRRLWRLFRYDMSTVNHALPDAEGCFRSERLERAITGTPGWQTWIATAGPHPVAFAVTRALDEPEHVLTSFFVLATARRGGLGLDLARAVLTAKPGHWAIAFQDSNAAAAAFWPRVAASLDPDWTSRLAQVPGRPDLPPDHWVHLRVAAPGQAR